MEVIIRIPEAIKTEAKRALFNHAVSYRFNNIAGHLRDDWGIPGFQLEAMVEWTKGGRKTSCSHATATSN